MQLVNHARNWNGVSRDHGKQNSLQPLTGHGGLRSGAALALQSVN